MANEYDSKGLLVQVGDGASPEVFTTIGGVSAVDVTAASTNNLSVMALEDTQDRTIKGVVTPGSWQLTINNQAGNALQAQLIADSDSATNVDRNYRVLKSDGSTVFMSVNAYAQDYNPSGVAVNSVVGGTVTLVHNATPTVVV